MGGQAPGVARGSARVGVSYFALFLVMSGTHSMLPLIMSWTANNLSPTSKRGVGTAFVTSIADAITIAAPQVYFDPEDGFRKGFAIIAGCYFLLFLVAFSLQKRLKMLNGRNRKILGEMSEHDRKELDREDEVYDSDPRFVFVT
ncbi:hypothetical protein VKT23_016731 [Stygiomarasmius scandens]|uniref:Uncharacterized protein n=1 Tax=Marasmiellus scandens TaxID=2682957 RepID=A0ABR1IY64_9AGAR